MNRIIVVAFCGISFFLFSTEYSFAAESTGIWENTSALIADDTFPESSAMIDVSDTEIMLVGIGTDAYFYNTVTDAWRKEMRFPTYTQYANPTVVKMYDGRILVTGMMGYSGDTTVPAQIYDPSTKKWIQTGQLVAPIRLHHTTTLLDDGGVLLAGGFGGSQAQEKYHLGEANIYDLQSNMWNITNNLHQPRSLHTATKSPDGSVIVAGGHGDTFINDVFDYTRAYAIRSVERYVPASGEWEIMSTMQQPRSAHTATLLPDGKILVAGGLQLDAPEIEKRVVATNSVEVYDPATDTWEYTGNMHERRAYHTATLLPNGKVLVTGGINGEPSSSADVRSLATAEVYDPVSKKLTIISSFRQARGKHAAIVLSDGRVLIVGGINNTADDPYVFKVVNSAELFTTDEMQFGDGSVVLFLRLPFDYERNGKSFEQIAYNPSAWFDHTYPLQSIACCTTWVTKYNSAGSDAKDYYRSHSGYDYALGNGVRLGTPILAAAAGKAAFVHAAKSGGGGNVIKIDHGNGYQTWYEHLAHDGLVVATEGKTVSVSRGQQIGKVGMTGNTTGPHIHFSVFTDENNNNSFQDDYPYGLVDALGWEGKDKNGRLIDDPWVLYTKNGRHGARSTALFTDRLLPKKFSVPVLSLSTTLHKNIRISIPENASPTFFSLDANVSAYKSDDNLKSAMPSFFLYARDNLGNDIKNFFAPITLLYTYAEADLSNIAENTLKMYFFDDDKKKWTPLPSAVDTEKKQVTAQTTHFTHFALMGEVKDKAAPQTTAQMSGEKGEEGWYRSDVQVSLDATDDAGLGVAYTFYSVNNGETTLYTKPFVLDMEGKYVIRYFSLDNADNREEPKEFTISLDKTAPEAEISYASDINKLLVNGKDTSGNVTMRITQRDKSIVYLFTDRAGNTMEMNGVLAEKDNRSQFSVDSLRYSENAPTTLQQNMFVTSVKRNKNDGIYQIDQRFSLDHDEKVVIEYAGSEDTTKMVRKESGAKRIVEEKTGRHLLRIFTEKGTLQFLST